ncbi:zinc ribbon domain-containing protein [bacterium]|nr:zinc ribbon domain-containing protein [candidate division CSSED10-310 bacterium]
MPLFEYECKKCGHRFTRILSSISAEKSVRCTQCQSDDIHRLISSFNSKAGGSVQSGKGCGHAGFS